MMGEQSVMQEELFYGFTPGLFNALVLDWVSPKCHTPMKPPSGGGVGDSCDALPCDSFAGNLHSRMGLPWHRSVHLLTC